MVAARLAPRPVSCIDGHATYEVLERGPGLLRVRCLYCQHAWAIVSFGTAPPTRKDD